MTNFSTDIIQNIKDRADIVEIVGGYTQLKRSGANNMGCCPFHQEKTPSFNVNTARQTFHCFGCGVGGDVIEFVQKIEGLEFPSAVRLVADRVGVDIQDAPSRRDRNTQQMKTPQRKDQTEKGWTPTTAEDPQDLWREKAAKLIEWANGQLYECQDKLDYLASRGLDRSAVEEYRLGWIPQNLFRPRESWGLETQLKENGKTKKLLIPAGIVIPYFDDNGAHRIRIRRKEGEPRYYWLPGSGNDVIILNPKRRGFVVVESDLDALLLDNLAGDLVGIVPLGTCSVRPRKNAAEILEQADSILIALDHDKAGARNTIWWKNLYPQAERWPSIQGKDPGEDYQAGIDLRQWIIEGLPPGLRVAAMVKYDHNEHEVEPTATLPIAPERFQMIEGISKNGHIYFVAENKTEAEKLIKEKPGSVVFTANEISKLKGFTSEEAEKFILLKQTFPQCTVRRTVMIENKEE